LLDTGWICLCPNFENREICYKQVRSGYGSHYIIVLDLRKIIGGGFFVTAFILNIREGEKDRSLIIIGSKKAYFCSKTIVNNKTFLITLS
jgi:hypothetical protein